MDKNNQLEGWINLGAIQICGYGQLAYGNIYVAECCGKVRYKLLYGEGVFLVHKSTTNQTYTHQAGPYYFDFEE